MVRHLRRHVRGEREQAGAAATLGFLVFFGVLMGVIFGFASSSLLSSDSLERERNGVYDADGAVNTAIAYTRKNADVGKAGATDCGMPTALVLNSANGVTVNCVADADSGEPLPSTFEPGFAILTLAQFTHYWSQNTLPPSCSTISTDPNAELGIMQFQNSKLLKVTGNVYVNSDVDSDVWSGGCPQVYDAKAINVEGKVKVRESCHDIFALQGFTWNCDQNGQTDQKTQADAAAAGRNPATPNGGQPANDPTLADPAIANPASWAPMITTPPAVAAVPACGTTSVVAFTPVLQRRGRPLGADERHLREQGAVVPAGRLLLRLREYRLPRVEHQRRHDARDRRQAERRRDQPDHDRTDDLDSDNGDEPVEQLHAHGERSRDRRHRRDGDDQQQLGAHDHDRRIQHRSAELVAGQHHHQLGAAPRGACRAGNRGSPDRHDHSVGRIAV